MSDYRFSEKNVNAITTNNGSAYVFLYDGSVYRLDENKAAKQVISAKQGAEITLKMGRWCAYPKWFMEKLAERRDLTIKLQFEYLHQQYEVMIPADTKIDTECDWYGPLKICSLYSYSVK